MITETLVRNVYHYWPGTWTAFSVGRRGYAVHRQAGEWVIGRVEANGREHHQRRITIVENGFLVTTMQGMVIDTTRGFPAAFSLAIV